MPLCLDNRVKTSIRVGATNIDPASLCLANPALIFQKKITLICENIQWRDDQQREWLDG
jgi:hypothetical protein